MIGGRRYYKKMNGIIKVGLIIFALFAIINFTVYKFSPIPAIAIMCISIILILVGAFARKK